MNKKHLFILLGILGCLLFTIAFSACRVVDASTLPKAIEVDMGNSNFLKGEVTIKKGQSITLISKTSSAHVIANGQWVNGAQDKKKEADAPVVSDVSVAGGGGSLTIGPFQTAGDFKYYCTIHQNMNLIVHVK